MSLADAGGVLDRDAQIGLNSWWKIQQYEYDVDNNPIYIGKNAKHDSGDDESSWGIWKLTWTTGNLTLMEGPLTGSWDDRATLSWR